MRKVITTIDIGEKKTLNTMIKISNLIHDAEIAEKNLSLKEMYKELMLKLTNSLGKESLLDLNKSDIGCLLLVMAAIMAKKDENCTSLGEDLQKVLEIVDVEECGEIFEEVIKKSLLTYYLYSYVNGKSKAGMASSTVNPYVENKDFNIAITNIMEVGLLSYTDFNDNKCD